MTKNAPRVRAGQGLLAAAWLSCVLTVTTDAASETTPPPCESAVLTLIEAADLLRIDADEMERLAEQNMVPARRIGTSWRFNCAALMEWLNGDWERTASAAAPQAIHPSSIAAPHSHSSLTTRDIAQVIATGTAFGQAGPTTSASVPPAPDQDRPVGEAPEERPAEDMFLRGQRVLLGRGEVVVDFGQFYSRRDTLELAAVDDRLGLATIEQETLTTVLLGRVGILDETELYAGTTFRSQGSDALLGGTNLARSSRTEFGGIGIGVRHTLLHEGVGRPDIIATFDTSIPTGDTSYALGGGLVFVKSRDPVILFASAHYSHAFSRDSANVTRLEPQGRFGVSMGYGLALNDTLAISTSFSGFLTGTPASDTATFRQPDIFSGRFGLTTRLANRLYIEPSVSFGLNGPHDNFAFGVTMPFVF